MIQNIVFDMGNVLIKYNPAGTLKDLGLSDSDAEIILREFFACKEWREVDRGTMSPEEAFVFVRKRLPEQLADFVYNIAIKESFLNLVPPSEEMEELVREIKKAGYKTFLLSNTPQNFYEFKKNYPVMELLDGIIISADLKIIKPEKEIFEALFKKYDLIPEECFFIDDMPVNVEGAKAAGMDGYCFALSRDSVDSLRTVLRRYIKI